MLCFDFPLEEKSFLTRMNFPSEGIFKEQIQYIDIKSSVLDPILKRLKPTKKGKKMLENSAMMCFHLQTGDQTTYVRNDLPYFTILYLFPSVNFVLWVAIQHQLNNWFPKESQHETRKESSRTSFIYLGHINA